MISTVVGIDEVGYGALAGPLILASYALSADDRTIAPFGEGYASTTKALSARLEEAGSRLADSKKLSRPQLTKAFDVFLDEERIGMTTIRVWISTPEEIDSRGLRSCWLDGVTALVNAAMADGAQRIVLDGDDLNDLGPVHLAAEIQLCRFIVETKADANYPAVSAASMLAKAQRLLIMAEHHKKHPEYGFDAHDGYGTARHLQAIAEHGPVKGLHRLSYKGVKEHLKGIKNAR
jgi:ribonuclease HII